jgi:hypothetical protein
MKKNVVFGILLLINTFLFAQWSIKISNEKGLHVTGQWISLEINSDNYEQITDNVLCLELFDQKTNIVNKTFIQLEGKSYKGRLYLDETLVSGTYILRLSGKSSESILKELNIINLETFKISEARRKEPLMINVAPSRLGDKPLEISGYVTHPDKNNVVVLQTRGDNWLFEYSVVSANGSFSFNPKLFGNNEVYITYLGTSKNIDITKLPYQNRDRKLVAAPYSLPTHLIDKDTIKQKIIDKNYQNSETSFPIVDPVSLIIDKTIRLEDYFLQKKTEDIIAEIIPLKKFRFSKNGYELNLLNTINNHFFKGEPLYLIDGFIVPDIEQILKIPPEQILKIDLIYNNQKNNHILGRIGRYGALLIWTKDGDYLRPDETTYKIIGLLRPN